jgi:hypothetical protein
MTDPIARTFWTAATAYIGARKPTDVLTHALVDAVMRLIAHRWDLSHLKFNWKRFETSRQWLWLKLLKRTQNDQQIPRTY